MKVIFVVGSGLKCQLCHRESNSKNEPDLSIDLVKSERT